MTYRVITKYYYANYCDADVKITECGCFTEKDDAINKFNQLKEELPMQIKEELDDLSEVERKDWYDFYDNETMFGYKEKEAECVEGYIIQIEEI